MLHKYNIKIDTTNRFVNSIEIVNISDNTQLDYIEGDINITSELSKLLKKHKISISQINNIIPNVGPGSFTGIKKGITLANVFNWATNYPNTNDIKYFVPNYGSKPNIHKS